MADDVLEELSRLDIDTEYDADTGLDDEEEEEPEEEDLESAQADTNIRNVIKIPDEERRTSRLMTIYEYTEAIGIRISQIENKSEIFTDYTGLKNNRQIATKEMVDRRNPLIVRRVVKTEGNNVYEEHWKVCEMIFPKVDLQLPTTQKKYEECVKALS